MMAAKRPPAGAKPLAVLPDWEAEAPAASEPEASAKPVWIAVLESPEVEATAFVAVEPVAVEAWLPEVVELEYL